MKPAAINSRLPDPVATMPAQDWELVVSKGHVLAAQMQEAFRFLHPFAVAGVFLALVGAFFALSISFRPIEWTRSLIDDPNTIAAYPDGTPTSYRNAWWSKVVPSGDGMTATTWDSLIKSVATDLPNGTFKDGKRTDLSTWEHVASLDHAPKITSPQKLFAWKDSLASGGVVAVPETPSPVIVVGVVEGQFSAVIVQPTSCFLFVGRAPATVNCPKNGYPNWSFLERFKPQ